MNVRAGVLVALLAAGGLAACGESGGQSTGAASPSTTFRDEGTGASSGTAAPKGSTPTSASQEASAIPLPNAWDIVVKGGGGYRFDVKLEIADKVVKVGTRHGNIAAGRACQLDPRKDVLIPFRVTLTNSTPGFSAAPASAFYMVGYEDAVEIGYTSTPKCQRKTDEGTFSLFAINSRSELATGKSIAIFGFLVAKNYYTPASPDGDRSVVRAIKLGVSTSAGTMEASYSTDSVTGPGTPRRQIDGWQLPVGTFVTG